LTKHQPESLHKTQRGQTTQAYFNKFLALVSFALLLATGCGDRISTADALALSAKPYTITVTGTATTPTGSILQHSTTVTLLLEQPQ
jgi:hypothetical protein